MKALVKKSVIAASVVSAMLFAGAASAATANPFQVTTDGHNFTANSMTGSYQETITFNTDGTFNVALLFQATAFNNAAGTAMAGFQTGLGNSYGLYALYNVAGTYSSNTAGLTTFKFTPDSGGISLYKDNDGSSYLAGGVTAPATGNGTYAIANAGADTLLATGQALDPSDGRLQTGVTCGINGINCGSFGSTTSFELTDAGKGFFVDPTPFYNLSFQSGVLTGFQVAETQHISGTLNVVFNEGAQVPEPASLGLLGLGLLGLGVARRRKQKQA